MVCQTDELFLRVFVAAFGPDGFLRLEMEGDRAVGNRDRLASARAEVHFDALQFLVEQGHVLELGEVEIGAKLSIDTGKQVAIERGGDAQRVVVGRNEDVDRFDQVGTQQKRIAGLQNRSENAEEFGTRITVKIAQRAAKK